VGETLRMLILESGTCPNIVNKGREKEGLRRNNSKKKRSEGGKTFSILTREGEKSGRCMLSPGQKKGG